MGGVIQELIPSSIYDSESKTAVIFCSSGFYCYEVIGMDEGTYGLNITSVSGGEEITFEATEIPTSTGVRHVYAVDWGALSAGGEGVILNIDKNGDGFFEQMVIADNELSYDEFVCKQKRWSILTLIL